MFCFGMAIGKIKLMKISKAVDLQPKIVLGIAAHPDDLDFGVSGSIARWVSQGATAYYLILTDGSKGSADRHISPCDLIAMRRKEQQTAANILGVKQVFFCDYEDGCLANSYEVRRDIVRIIRQVKPDVVVTMDPTMVYSLERNFINHPDHRAAGQATLDAVFPLARDHLSFPELLAEGLKPHAAQTVLLIHFERRNYFVDISATIDKKLQALAAHTSQMSDVAGTQEVMKDLAEDMGRQCDCQCAEAFIRIDIAPL